MLYIYKINLESDNNISSGPAGADGPGFICQCIIDAQKMHQFLCGLVHSDRKAANLLYKLDEENGYLFLQSDIHPDESQCLKLLYTVDIDNILSKRANQSLIHFRLTTDTHRKRTDGSGITKKVHVPRDEILPWIVQKLARYGVNVLSIEEIQKKNISFKHTKKRGGYATITTHEFEIEGIITDINLLRQAWRNGMGEHKAYGNGLFLLCR